MGTLPHPTPKLHNILIMGVEAPRSKHISNSTTNQTEIDNYIQTYDTTNKHKSKQHQQILQNKTHHQQTHIKQNTQIKKW